MRGKNAVQLLTVLVTLSVAGLANTVGTLAIGSGGSVVATLSSLSFTPDPSSIPSGSPFDAEVSTATNLRFAGCVSGLLGSAGCLKDAEGVIINHDNPLGPAFPLVPDHFLDLAGNGINHTDLNFMLTTIFPGSTNANCASTGVFQSCSAYVGSPVVLTNFGAVTVAAIALAGTVSDGSKGAALPWVGSLSSTFPGFTPGQVQRYFCPSGTCTAVDFEANKSLTTSYSGTFAAVIVPELGSPVLLGSGLLVLSLLAKRLRRS